MTALSPKGELPEGLLDLLRCGHPGHVQLEVEVRNLRVIEVQLIKGGRVLDASQEGDCQESGRGGHHRC